ncbi:MAG: DNA translocase FtsK 4TM domain-containing protein [Endomicrobium sp.]|nr:DNA translocase FtsK 4TM domain-containing protein [Endomicrobium sp.]
MGKNRVIKNKNKNRDNEKINRRSVALFFALAVFLSVYVLVVPYKSGMMGRAFYFVTFSIFGTSAYILPFIFLWQFILHIRQSSELKGRLDFIWSFLCMICASVLFEAVHFMFKTKNISGGWLGDNLYPFLKELFDAWLGLFLIAVLTFILFVKILRLSVIRFFCSFFVNLRDYIKKLKTKIGDSNKSGKLFIQQSFTGDVFTYKTGPNVVNRFDEKKNKRKESSEEICEKQELIDNKAFNYVLPPVTLLKKDDTLNFAANKNELLKRAEYLKTILIDFDINAEVKDIIPGPVLTRYDLVLAPGIRIQTVSNIIDNISLAMRTASIRIVPIPEKSVVGIEVPNPVSVIVGLRGILESVSFEKSKSLLTLAFGKTTDGAGYVANLASMPHLLIAGATGSGKSVGIHTIIISILYKARPDEVKFMLIDPKRVEMSIYRNIPHLYNPCTIAANANIITNPREAAVALKKLILVMEERYTKFANVMVRNIEDYNNKILESGGEKEFYIVVIIDELADLMLVLQKEIEDSIQRLAQMARAVGIHLILATQRPSVNVITGVIKANFPARLSFQTTSKIDSRIILDMLGAESLIGKGDMLFLPSGEVRPVRLQGAFVSLKEAEKVISFINNQNFPKFYEVVSVEVERKGDFAADKKSKDLIPALKLISERRRISQDLLKANFGGSARAANILSILEIGGFISKPKGTNKWQINFDKISKYLDINNI